jgi:hypothetical protein
MKSLLKLIVLLLIIALSTVHAQNSLCINNEAKYLSASAPCIVNVPEAPAVTIGVSETRDAAALFFQMYESYLKASADGQVNFSDIKYLLAPAMLLIPAFSGASQIIPELKSLTDEQVQSLLLVADEYELGDHAQRAKQAFKTLLTLAQTYFIFEAAAAK